MPIIRSKLRSTSECPLNKNEIVNKREYNTSQKKPYYIEF